MDNRRFDEISKTLASSRPGRRGFIRGLLGVAIAAWGGGHFGRSATAQAGCMDASVCGDEYCDTGTDINGECICHSFPMGSWCRGNSCASHDECGTHAVCMAIGCEPGLGTCMPACPTGQAEAQVCPDGTESCNGACVDLSSDTENCGACGNVCSLIDGITLETNACIEGQCTTVCGADLCGDECVDLQLSVRHCGACGNSCAEGEMCCGERCFNPNDYERYCDYCGYQGGFPQGCNADEVCDGGLCVPAGGSSPVGTFWLGSWTCPQGFDTAELFEPPMWVIGPEPPYAYDLPGCTKDDGLVYNLFDAQGNQLATCTTVEGLCGVEMEDPSAVTAAVAENLPPGLAPQEDSTVHSGLAVIVNAGQVNEVTPALSGTVPESGTLAYAIRTEGHWSIWTHDFATNENIELVNVPNSDQFAPSYSHDGTRIAYLSDQVDLVNQVWVMDASGSNQRQLSTYTGTGSLVHVAWSYDDSAIVATEVDATNSPSMLSVPPDGGPLNLYTDEPGGWPTFSDNDRMVYISEGDFGTPWVVMILNGEWRGDIVPARFGDSFVFGNPNLAPPGRVLALDSGDPGARQVIAFIPYTDVQILSVPKVGTDDGDPVVSPDESQLAFVAITGDEQSIVIYSLDGSRSPTPIDLPDHDRVWYLSWQTPPVTD